MGSIGPLKIFFEIKLSLSNYLKMMRFIYKCNCFTFFDAVLIHNLVTIIVVKQLHDLFQEKLFK